MSSEVCDASSAGAQADPHGVFVTFEGSDGVGKSTQAARLVAHLSACGCEVVALREPGGTAISEKIRGLLLDPSNDEMADECELLLYEAARAQLVRQVIEPALARGAVVVCDRFFDSTHAYQAGGRGLSDVLVRAANELGCCGVVPDLTFVLDLDPAYALKRAVTGVPDRMEAEGLAFQQRVRADYRNLAAAEPARVRLIDAAGTPDEVFAHIVDELARAELLVGEGLHE